MKDKINVVVTSLPVSDEITEIPYVPVAAVQAVLDDLNGKRMDLVLFPQYSMIEGVTEEEEKAALLSSFALDNGCYVVYNSLRPADGRQASVSVILDRNGQRAGEYIKSHRIEGMDIDLALGDEMPVFDLDFGKVALLAGTDLYIPELAEIYSLRGAELLLCSMGTQCLRDDTEIQRLLKGRSVADYVYVAASTYASDNKMYMASNVDLYHAGKKEFSVSGDVSSSFNAFGLGKHTGKAAIYDLKGEIVASTGRESGYAQAEVHLHRKRNLAEYNFGTGCLLFHQNERGVFQHLQEQADFERKTYPVENPVISLVHLEYKDTFQNESPDWYRSILDQIREAARYSDLVVCSEYSRGDDGKDETVGLRDFLQGCSELARDNRCYVAVNEVIDKMNTSLLFDRNGELIHKHQKVNPLNMMYQKKPPAGNDIEAVELDFGKVGFMICADSYCQEIPRVHALKGAEIIILQTQSWGYDANAINEGFSRAWAIENCMYVVTSNFPTSQVMHRSCIIDPTGETVFASNYDMTGIYSSRINLDAVGKKLSFVYENGTVKKDYDVRKRLMRARRPELYKLLCGTETSGTAAKEAVHP